MHTPFVHLDSLDPGREPRSLAFHHLRREIVAHTVDEVLPAVRAVEAAAVEGCHAAGFLAYEAAPAFEPRLATRPPRPGLPLVWFGVFADREERPACSWGAPAGEDAAPGPFEASVVEAEYLAAVGRIAQWIAAGDTYQVNHTFRLRAPFHGDEDSLYRRICAAQRAGYCAHLRLPRFSILSASPELFFRWRDGQLTLRPMKGTRPRGRWGEEDERRAAELLASAKDRAENLMIVDLLRNDAGRVSRFGSVAVPRLFELERYPTVHQLTSTVQAETLPGTRLEEVLRALFPCGSVTGAPKIRTSQIIAELEDSPRGVYTGAIGFVSPDEAVFSVAIRTLLLDRATATLELGVGSGITADSDAAAEYRECLGKAAFVRHAPTEFDLLESLRYEAGAGYPFLEEHLARLAASARYFGFPLNEALARERLASLAAALPTGVHKVRLLLGRAGEVRVESEPIPAALPPARVALASEPVDERDAMLYHKTTARGPYRRRADARPDCDDVLLVNRHGELTEATSANLVVRLEGRLLTPPLAAGLLPGVLRAHLLARGEVEERTLRPADLHRADALYLVNSVRGWRAAVLEHRGTSGSAAKVLSWESAELWFPFPGGRGDSSGSGERDGGGPQAPLGADGPAPS